MLKLYGKLIRFTRGGTYIYDIQEFFKKKLTPQPPSQCAQNLFVKRTFVNWEINPFQSKVPILYLMKT